MNTAIIQAIKEVYDSKGKENAIDLNENTRLREDLGFDSFDLAELTVRIEEKTGIDIFEQGIVSTIGQIHNIIEQ